MVARLREKAELEKQLQKAQKMEAVGTLAGGIAHDFNNILGVIIGYTELTQDEVPQEMHSQHYLSQTLKACHRAKELILQILSFARQSAVERQALELNSIVKETLKLLKVTLPENVELRYVLESRSSFVIANPTQIHQTIMNLCTNAVHAMKETGGVLTLTIQNYDVANDELCLSQDLATGHYVKISISDTGPGISHELLQRIFDPYFTTKTPYEGTGLGLSICLGIMENHGGTISVESVLGEGSTFTILLPKRDDAQSAQSEELLSFDRELYGDECVLFVDDEAFLVEIGRDTLEQLGYRVMTAMNGQEALELFQTQPDRIDLVITDQTMPKMTGVELAKKVLDSRPGTPIILCTGFSENLTEEQAKELGIREFLLKPLSKREMALVIRKVLNKTG
jgi:nitrogen-specific signal transduction histidine kinase/CheY-like chemotaxis protein